MNVRPPDLPGSVQELQVSLRFPELSVQEIINLIKQRCCPCKFEYFQDGKHIVIILPESTDELESMVCYGKRRTVNCYEQHYLGLGHRFMDKDGNIITVISRFLCIYSASRGPSHAKVISEENDAMLDILEQEREIQNRLEHRFNKDENGHLIDPFLKYGPSEVVLFGHTHPDLGVFFSPTDHDRNYSTPTSPIVTFVCDPIRKDMKAMTGVKGEATKIIVCRQVSKTAPGMEMLPPAPHREQHVHDLWQQAGRIANLLLQQTGVSGNFDCHRDWRGNTRMRFRITHRKPRHPEQP